MSYYGNNDIFERVEQLLKVKPIQQILDSLGIQHSAYRGGQVIRGKCPDHYFYTGRYPSGDTDWVINVNTGVTFCHTEKRASNIVLIAKKLKGFATLQQAFNFISDGYTVQNKFQKFLSGEKRVGFNPHNIIHNQNKHKNQDEQFNRKIKNAMELIYQGYVDNQTIAFFSKDNINIETIKKFNVVTLKNGFSKYRCLIPFYDYKDLGKLVGYVCVNTLSKHEYIKRFAHMMFQLKNITSYADIRHVYLKLLQKYRKAIYLKGSMMRQNLFGLNNLIKQRKDLKQIYVVQGERDAMKMQQEGFSCVGTHGSHITFQQLEILKNVGCKTICIMFDGDNAGREGAKKSIQFAFERGFKAYDFNPQSKDPKKYDRNELLNLVKKQIHCTNEWSGLINESKLTDMKLY